MDEEARETILKGVNKMMSKDIDFEAKIKEMLE